MKELKRGMLGAFPKFRENTYFQMYAEAEHKAMIDMLVASTEKFFYIYGLKVWVRKLRKQLGI